MEDKKYFSRLGLLYLVGGAFVRLLSRVLGVILYEVKPEILSNANLNLIISAVLMYGIGFPIMIILVKSLPGSKPEQHSLKASQWLGALASSFTIVYAANILGLMLTGIIGSLKGSAVENVVMETVTEVNPFISLIVMVLIAPVMEELVFRKMLVDRVHQYGQGVTILLSGVVFGLYHGNLNQFMYAFFLGMFLAFIYVKTGKIIYTIMIHMTINGISGGIVPILMKMVDFNGYYAAAMEGDTNAMMELLTGHMGGWILMGLLAITMVSLAIAGLIVLIVNRKRFTLEAGEITIPAEKRFETIFGNWGMGAFCVFWILVIVAQLFL